MLTCGSHEGTPAVGRVFTLGNQLALGLGKGTQHGIFEVRSLAPSISPRALLSPFRSSYDEKVSEGLSGTFLHTLAGQLPLAGELFDGACKLKGEKEDAFDISPPHVDSYAIA